MNIRWNKISNIQLADVNPSDYPDFSDAYIKSAEYEGRWLTEKELDDLNENRELVYEIVIQNLF